MAVSLDVAAPTPAAAPCCRICLESENAAENPLIAPCACKGTMAFVHRACLDEWRMSCVQPRAIVECTTCSTKFRMKVAEELSVGRCWTRLALAVCKYLLLRILGFLSTSWVLGFGGHLLLGPMPAYFANSALDQIFHGGICTLLMVGVGTIVHAASLVSWSTFDIFDLCPRRAGKDVGEAVLVVLVLLGLCVCLFFLLRGVYEIVRQGPGELGRAFRSANREVRREVVLRHAVLDLEPGDSSDDVEAPP